MSEREAHMRGLLRLVSPSDKAHVKRWSESSRGRERLLKWLSHGTGLDARYFEEPARGERDGEKLLRAMQGLGAPRTCYVISSDGHLDDAFCDLTDVLTIELGNFTHGTIVSAVPEKLAFFRSAGFSYKHLIVPQTRLTERPPHEIHALLAEGPSGNLRHARRDPPEARPDRARG